jgi:hypothetical protein
MVKSGRLLAVAMIALCTAQVQAINKYDIKSAIITLESVMKVAGMEIKTTKLVYFDDYGIKERVETYSNGKLSIVIFTDGKDRISLSLDKKTATRDGNGDNGTGPHVDINFFGTTKDIESGVVKQLPPMILAGQTCEVFHVNTGSAVQTYAAWKKVMVYTKIDVAEMKAVKIEANAVVPKEKFQIPAGFTVQ